MSAYDSRYFKDYYEKNKVELLKKRQLKYKSDEAYRKKAQARAKLYRRLEIIIDKIHQLLREEKKWRQKKNRKKP